MATLPGAQRYRICAGTGWPSVSILWLGEMEVWQHIRLSEQIRPWDTLACYWDIKQPTNKLTLVLFNNPLYSVTCILFMTDPLTCFYNVHSSLPPHAHNPHTQHTCNYMYTNTHQHKLHNIFRTLITYEAGILLLILFNFFLTLVVVEWQYTGSLLSQLRTHTSMMNSSTLKTGFHLKTKQKRGKQNDSLNITHSTLQSMDIVIWLRTTYLALMHLSSRCFFFTLPLSVITQNTKLKKTPKTNTLISATV